MKEKFKILVLFLVIGLQTYGQTKKISGTVTDDTGQSLPGTSVLVVGTKQGAVTDIAGKYVINAEPGAKLKFSFVGFVDEIKTVGKEAVINVKMASDSKKLEEVVVVGYSTQKKSTVVGSVAQTTGEALKRQGNVSNITESLQGAIPGLTVLPSSGQPGGGGINNDGATNKATEILIRGKSTWNNSGPLILVDGIERNMNDLDINEVETISVLKDASATAVYGMKGGNGVILITSKRGSTGKAKLTVEYNQTYEALSKYSENVDAYNGILARNRAIVNEVDLTGATSWNFYRDDAKLDHWLKNDLPYAYPSVNWREEVMKDYGTSNRLNLTLSGGNKLVKYFGSMSYNHQGDIFDSQDLGQGFNPEFAYDRFNFRTNLDFNVTSTTLLTVNLSGLYGKQKRNGVSIHSFYNTIFGHTPESPVVQYEDGVWGYSIDGYVETGANAVATSNLSGVNIDNRTELNTDFTVVQKLDVLTKGLNVKARLAFDNYFSTDGRNINNPGILMKHIKPEFYEIGGSYNYATQTYEIKGVPITNQEMVRLNYASYQYPAQLPNNFEWVVEPYDFSVEKVESGKSSSNLYYEAGLNYARTFGKHAVTGLALFNRQQTEVGAGWPQKREDWVGRVTYGYNDRYFGEVNAAYNGSEKFGTGYKFDFFPSVAVGWNVANEKLVKEHAKFINNLKFKYGYGVTGNDRVDNVQWGYITTWTSGGPWADDKDNGLLALDRNVQSYLKYAEGTPGNPDLRWEKQNKHNFGVEFGFLGNALTGTFDYFTEHRYDILISGRERSIPVFLGQKPPTANIGIVDSHGYEFQIAYQKAYASGFNFLVGASYARAENEIIEKEDPALLPFYQKQAGYPIGQTRTQISTGFINSFDDLYTGVNSVDNAANTLPGDARILDYDGNGSINDNDSALYGYPAYPLNTYTANFTLGYKGFSLSALFYGTNETTRTVGYSTFAEKGPTIQPFYIEDTWTPEYGNANPTYPQLNFSRPNVRIGEYNVYDGSVIRLRSAEFAYTLPKNWSKAFASSNTRLFINGNNLFLWTDMPSDGEGSNQEAKSYPLKKSLTIGVNIQF
jgi:TonB-linked SusC/RagA family outer membrane protein